MKFFKEHWFAILFDILFTLAMISGTKLDFYSLIVLALVLLIIIGIQVSWHKITSAVRRHLPSHQQEEMTKDMEEHYANRGLSEDETAFFRKTMAEAKDQILTLEDNMENNAQLALINEQTKVLVAAKGIFKELVKEPKKLHMMGPFLYTHLPNLSELVAKYNEVMHHEIKSQKTTDTLNQSLDAIRNLSYVIVNDYEEINSDDIQALNDGIDLAKRNLNQQIQHQKENVH